MTETTNEPTAARSRKRSETELPLSLQITDEQKKTFYLSLARLNLVDAAKGIGLGERYTTDNSIRAISFRLLKSIDPRLLGLSEDTITIVKDALEGRRAKAHTEITDGAQPELLDPEDSKMLVIGGKNKAAMLLHKKFDRLMKNKKMLDEVSLSQLATTFGIMFDKSQILRGEATENIAVMANVKSNMTPEESLEVLLKMREIQQEEKHG